MKKIIITIFAFLLLCTSTISTNAASPSARTVEILTLEDGYQAVITTEITEVTGIARAASSKTATRTYNIKNSSGQVMATYKLTAEFTYNGSTSSCTSASCSTSIFDNTWEFTGATSSRSGNKAVGNFSARCTLPGITNRTITDKVTLICDKNGNIS